MLSSRWHFLLLLLQVLPSTCDYESWNRQRELDKKREMVSQATRQKEDAEERIAQAEAKLASLPPLTSSCGQCLPLPSNATGLKVARVEYKCSEDADTSLVVSCEDGVCPKPNQWPACDQIDEATLKPTPMPGILIAGGTTGGYRYGASAETFPDLFPSRCESWRDLGRSDSSLSVIPGREATFVACGGTDIWGNDNGQSQSCTSYSYSSSWAHHANLREGRIGHASAMLDGHIMLLGGNSSNSKVTGELVSPVSCGNNVTAISCGLCPGYMVEEGGSSHVYPGGWTRSYGGRMPSYSPPPGRRSPAEGCGDDWDWRHPPQKQCPCSGDCEFVSGGSCNRKEGTEGFLFDLVHDATGGCAIAGDGEVIVIGGGEEGSLHPVHGHVSRYGLSGFIASRPGHPAHPDLLGPRTEHACAGFSTSTNHAQQAYIVTGGHRGDGVGLYTTEILLPGASVWTLAAPLPQQVSSPIRMKSASLPTGEMFFVGGTKVLRYDPASDSWEKVACTNRDRHAVVAVDLVTIGCHHHEQWTNDISEAN